MKNVLTHIHCLNIVVIFIAGICACHAGPSDKYSFAAKKGIVGTWNGKARTGVIWAEAKEVPVSIVIHHDGNVSGKVGEATVTGGKVNSGRGWLLKSLGWGCEILIKAKLEGYIIEAEGIRRDFVNIPCHLEDGELRGGLHSSGSKIGDKRTMIFSAKLVLLRVSSEGGVRK